MTYAPIGKMASVTDSRGTTTYSYDARQRLIEQKEADGKFLRYGYDAASNRTLLATPTGTSTFTYDKYNQLATVSDPTGNLTTYTYDKAGNLTQTIMPNAVLETRSYDTLNRLTQIQSKKGGTVLFSATYTLDNAGMRTKVVETGRTVDYTYDNLYRLLSENDGVSSSSYSYDPTGNRLTKTNALGTATYIYDGNDRLLSDGTTTYTYDANGNKLTETKAGVTTTYTWDAESRLKGSQSAGTNTVYDYEFGGIRVSQSVNGVETRYLVDKNRNYAQVLEEYAPNGTVNATYIYGNDLISQSRNAIDSFYGYDGLGSTRVLTDELGVVTDTYAYDAYGTLTASTGTTQNNYLYAGEQFDKGLNQYYLRDRYYGTDIGRFTQRDRFEGDMMQPLSLNRYGYTHGNPINDTDPSGMFAASLVALETVLQGAILATGAYLGYQIGQSLSEPNSSSSGSIAYTPITLSRTLPRVIAAEEIERCALFGDTDCYVGFPIVFYGAEDFPEHSMHIFKAHVGWGNTLSNNVATTSFPTPRRETGLINPLPSFLFKRADRWDDKWLDDVPSVNGTFQTEYTARTGNVPNRDEYPFAATWDGGESNYYADKVSVELVDAGESKRQGGLMSAFYAKSGADIVANDPNKGYFGVIALPFRQVSSGWIDRNGRPGAIKRYRLK